MLYFDHSATTPPHPQVIEKMNEISELNYGNPSSLYSSGRKAKTIIENARRMVAKTIEASPDEIFLQAVELKQIIWLFGHLFMVRKNIL